MKKFETPEIEIVKFDAMDVIAASDGGQTGGNGTLLPDVDL